MSAELFLIAPAEAAPEQLLAALEQTLATAEPAAILLTRGSRSEADYEALIRRLAPVAQAAGAAVLVEGSPTLVRRCGVDGLHVTADPDALKAAITALKPDLIVGIGGVTSRHDAMQFGELDVDYILFGPLSGSIDQAQRDLAYWWAETMEIPSVLSDPDASFDNFAAGNCEFIGLPLGSPEK